MSVYRNILTVLALAGLGLVAGCSMDRAPTAQDETQAPKSRILVAFSPEAAQRAAKVAGSALQGTVTKTIGPAGGELGVGKVDNDLMNALGTLLVVPPGGLRTEVEITMSLYGSYLSELVVEFAPGGLVFNNPAQLLIRIGKNRVDLPIQQMVILHQHEDGTVTLATFAVTEAVKSYLIAVEVPGFSLYSLGGGI